MQARLGQVAQVQEEVAYLRSLIGVESEEYELVSDRASSSQRQWLAGRAARLALFSRLRLGTPCREGEEFDPPRAYH